MEQERADELAAQEIPQEPVYYLAPEPQHQAPVIIQRGPEPMRRKQPMPQPLKLMERWGDACMGSPKKRRH